MSCRGVSIACSKRLKHVCTTFYLPLYKLVTAVAAFWKGTQRERPCCWHTRSVKCIKKDSVRRDPKKEEKKACWKVNSHVPFFRKYDTQLVKVKGKTNLGESSDQQKKKVFSKTHRQNVNSQASFQALYFHVFTWKFSPFVVKAPPLICNGHWESFLSYITLYKHKVVLKSVNTQAMAYVNKVMLTGWSGSSWKNVDKWCEKGRHSVKTRDTSKPPNYIIKLL